MNSSFRIILSLALQLSAAGALIACGGDEKGSDGTGTDTNNVDNGGLTLAFNPMYSAFEPNHTYQVPVIVDSLPPEVTWEADPKDAVTIAQGPMGGALLTMLKAGEVTIKAKTPDGKTGSAKLTIEAATSEDYELGRTRYNSMNAAITRTDAGVAGLGIDPNASCTNCHGETSALGVQHSPQQTAGYSSEQLIKIFTEGSKPEGAPQRTQIPAMAWQMFHKWQMKEEEKKAIVVYLRSLPPMPTNANVDFLGAIRKLLPDGGLNFGRFGDGGFPGFRRDGGFGGGGGGGTTGPGTTGPTDAGTSSTTTVTPSNLDAGT